jgi:hypothetical protein
MPIPSEEGIAIVVRSGQLEKRSVNGAKASESVHLTLAYPWAPGRVSKPVPFTSKSPS